MYHVPLELMTCCEDVGWLMVNFAKGKGKLTEEETHRYNLEVDSVAEGRYDYHISKSDNLKLN